MSVLGSKSVPKLVQQIKQIWSDFGTLILFESWSSSSASWEPSWASYARRESPRLEKYSFPIGKSHLLQMFLRYFKQASSRYETSLLSENTKLIRNFNNVEKWNRVSTISDIPVMAKNMKTSIKHVRNFNNVGCILCEFWTWTLQDKGHPRYVYINTYLLCFSVSVCWFQVGFHMLFVIACLLYEVVADSMDVQFCFACVLFYVRPHFAKTELGAHRISSISVFWAFSVLGTLVSVHMQIPQISLQLLPKSKRPFAKRGQTPGMWRAFWRSFESLLKNFPRTFPVKGLSKAFQRPSKDLCNSLEQAFQKPF